VKLPLARVVRDVGDRVEASDVAAPTNVRRLAARRLPRGIAPHLLFGGELGSAGWGFILTGHALALLCSDTPMPERRFLVAGMSAWGLVHILWQLRIGRRTLWLLRHGVASWGSVDVQTKVRYPARSGPPIVTWFGFPIEGGAAGSIRIRTYRGEFANGEHSWILYDAANPGRAMVLRRAPGAPDLPRGEGELVFQRRLRAWTVVILPLAGVVLAVALIPRVW